MGLIEKILKKLGLQVAPKTIEVSENRLALPRISSSLQLFRWFVIGGIALIALLFFIIVITRYLL